jgi:hypothetical protein
VPSYAALWWGGRFAARGTAQPLPAVLRGGAALGVAVVGAFLLSNLGYFAFGPDTALSASEYAARVAGYLPAYLLVTATYTGVALLAGLLAVRAAQAARH